MDVEFKDFILRLKSCFFGNSFKAHDASSKDLASQNTSNSTIEQLSMQNNYLVNKIKYQKLLNDKEKLDNKKDKLDFKEEKHDDWFCSDHGGLYVTIVISLAVTLTFVLGLACVL